MATDKSSVFDRQSVWFVTGCSTGFGRELASQLLARGNSVVVTARNPESLSAFAGMTNRGGPVRSHRRAREQCRDRLFRGG
jgi:NAD(P)-dependent dehydrogenase (short-subunit alcohol dehydrogenase family)